MKYYDIIIVGGGAAGFFTAINSPLNKTKLLLEKQKDMGVKVLLSGGERANLTNIDIIPERDYFGQNKKALISMFKKFNQYDAISYFSNMGASIVEEDRGRMILESGDSKELLAILVKNALKNKTMLKTNSGVIEVKKVLDLFEIKTISGDIFHSEKLVITTGGKSFPQVGTTGDGYQIAKNFGHTILEPHRGLSGLVTITNLSEISGISTNLELKIFSKITKKEIYKEFGPLLFTHFGVSGPIIFNGAVAIGEYINSLNLDEFISSLDFSKIPENEKNDFIQRSFIKENIYVTLDFDLENTPKKLKSFFNLDLENTKINLSLQDYRSWREAKVTGGGVKIDELTNNLESKLVKNLYFAGEILDITGKTGGFNLQLSWTSGFIVGQNIYVGK
ncbi:aminoacetone oxidase family FAD-binding enzyme [Candidatus Gracilibacteria bacterium]|nr:aminoacetone oxidase family FAD-binding enzyme [Candidatus Gracilibacteria bacterium]